MRMRWTAAAALVLAVALATGYLIGTGNRAGAQPAAGAAVRSWPPAPKDIVNGRMPQEQKIPMSMGADGYLVFQVPQDRWLVITDATIGSGSIMLFEESQGKTAIKVNVKGAADQPTSFASGVGAAFAPGSKVLASNHDTSLRLNGYIASP